MYIASSTLQGLPLNTIKNIADLTPIKQGINLNKIRFIRPRSDGVSVIGYPFDWFRIKDTTVEEVLNFMKNPTDDVIFKDIFHYGRGTDMCEICYGFGVLDWVNKAVKSKRRIPNQEDYKNFEMEVIIEHYKKSTNELVYYSITSKLRPGEERCSVCFGSGFRLHMDGASTTFLTSTGHTYKKYFI